MNRPLNAVDREQLLAELVRREEGRPGDPPLPIDESSVAAMRASLDTLVANLRQPPPFDAFEDESGCHRAVELAEQAGRQSASGLSSAASPDADGPALERIGPYQIVATLGGGGMGVVYRARHDRLKRVVAVKVLSARRVHDPESRARFEREMEAIGALNHPHIVAAHDAGETDGMHYLVMECVEGLDLATLVRRAGALPIADACEIIRQAAQGLKAANDREIVHRDVKPSNLMLAEGTLEHPEATVKVLDFGLARLAPLQADLRDLTLSGQIMGTLKYMAPEQGASSRNIDVRTDIYSLGATLYKLLCGLSPFSHEQYASPLALLAALGNQDPPPLSSRRPDVPAKLAAIVQRMMAKSPDDRFASLQDAIEALTPWARGARLTELLQRARAMEDPGESARPHALYGEKEIRATPAGSSSTNRQTTRSALPGVVLGGAIGFLLAWAVFLIPTIKKGGAEPSSTSVGAADSTDPFQYARNAAEWVQLRGGALEIAFDDTGSRALGPTDALPKANFHLNSASLTGVDKVAGADLARFNDLPFFYSLMLNRTPVDDDALGELGRLPLLKCLYLSETRITDAALAHLQRYPQLTHMHLHGTAITDAGLVQLAEFRNLNQLYLVGCRVSDKGLSHIASLKKLGTLWLEDTDVTAAGIARLKRALPSCFISSSFSEPEIAAAVVTEQQAASPSAMSAGDDPSARSREAAEWLAAHASEIQVTTAADGLVTLQTGRQLPRDFLDLVTANLDGSKTLSNEDLARFDKLPLFTALSVGQTRIDDRGLRRLGALPMLRRLYLTDTEVADAGLKELERYPKLDVLHLYGTQVTDAGLVYLAGLTMLTDLSLVECGITDKGVINLTELKRLQTLALDRTGVTPRGIVTLQQSLPDCAIHSDFSPQELAEAREALPNVSNQPENL